jgi:predicted dehydrogenase
MEVTRARAQLTLDGERPINNPMNGSCRTPRREFLRRLGVAATGTGLSLGFPSLFLNRTEAVAGEPPSEVIRVGCIGVGNQGRTHLLMNVKNVVAVCEVDRNRLKDAVARVEERTGRPPAAYGDYRKLLENRDVDAVIISTPDHWHALPAIHACQAGKDVYVEKPLTLTVLEGKVMTQAARRCGRIVQTGSQQRSDDKFRRACELVRSGRLGKVHTVRVGIAKVNFDEPAVPDGEPPPELDYDFWLGPAPKRPYNQNRVHYNFRFFWDYSGGQMTNWGAHHLDIAQWGLGMDETGPVEIEGQAKYDERGRFEVPTWCQVVYKYANGVTVICGQGERGGTTFEGDKGRIHVNRGKLESDPPEIIKEPLREQDVHLYVSAHHHRNWYECIKSRKPPICDVAVGHRTATVCHLGNIALRTNRKIKWDPVKEEILGDPEASARLTYAYRAPWKLPEI